MATARRQTGVNATLSPRHSGSAMPVGRVPTGSTRCLGAIVGDNDLQAAPRVLIVENEPAILFLLKEVLEDCHLEVDAVLDGQEGLDRFRSTSARRYDVLITDIGLRSAASGWDVARAGRDVAPDLCVIYMTGDTEAEWLRKGVSLSVLIQKPFTLTQLVASVSRLLDQRAVLKTQAAAGRTVVATSLGAVLAASTTIAF